MQRESPVVNYRSVLDTREEKRYANVVSNQQLPRLRIFVIFNQDLPMLSSLYSRECGGKVIEDCVKYAGECTRAKRVW